MQFTKDTKLKAILAEYPWLIEEAIKMDKRFEVLNSPMARAMAKRATIADLAKRADRTPERLIEKLEEMIAAHQA